MSINNSKMSSGKSNVLLLLDRFYSETKKRIKNRLKNAKYNFFLNLINHELNFFFAKL